jgi:hypothetical protein
MRSLPAACVLALVAATAAAAESTLVGYARSVDSGRLLYVETHFVSRDGSGAERRVVVYRCAQGAAPFARKELVYGADRNAPSFMFADARSGFIEGLTRDSAGWRVYARGPKDVTTRTAMLESGARFVADAGFDEFVRGNWDALARGTAFEVPFLVPSRLGTLPFRVRKLREELVAGENASVFRLSVAGPLGWFLPDIDVSYRDRDRRLARYRGLTNIRDESGAPFEAHIDFPDPTQQGVPAEAAALRAMPLAARCDDGGGRRE